MSIRARLTLVAAAAVALAVVLASAVVWILVHNQLYSTVDQNLRQRAEEIAGAPLRLDRDPDGHLYLDVPRPVFLPGTYVQLVGSGGATYRTREETGALPVSGRALEVARGRGETFIADATVAGIDVRVLTVPVQDFSGHVYALQVASPLGDIHHTLGRITLYLLLIAAGGIAFAAALGLLVARAALAPVGRLTRAIERVTSTRDLSERIEATGRDELSRLATSFNAMLGALEDSTRLQRQLVADASHELRTPLTSLRTNIEVLVAERPLAADERQRLLHDVVEQLGEMTALIAELVELARGEQPLGEPEDVRLDLLTADAVERARRNRPGVVFTTDVAESLVRGVPASLERAVANLLDNAAKWSPPGGEIEVSVRGGEVVVRDHGPGIDDEDLPYVFDRFYRARSARGMPGSGLGLAIVRQVAEAHGGDVVAERATGGGTIMRLRLDGAAAVTDGTRSS